MIPRLPRFANPHLVPQKEVKVNRKQIYSEHGDEDDFIVSPDAEELDALNNLIECGLLVPQIVVDSPVKSKKRRKLNDGKAEEFKEEEIYLFRLVSSRLSAQPLSLLPPPPPPSKTREPDAEDSEEQAELRRVRSHSVAVNIHDIQSSATIEKSRPFSKQSISVKTSALPCPLAVLSTFQQPRKTRPPVPFEFLQQYPYAGRPSSSTKDSAMSLPQECSLLEVVPIETSTRKSRRRNRAAKNKERPPPQFWRPDPSWGGKSLGYAYGYPSSLAVMQGFGRTDNWRYQRDSMANIIT